MPTAHEITARILDGRDGEDPTQPETVQALPLVLRLEKSAVPPRDRLLAAAARACAALCLDERVATDPFWSVPYQNWIDARVRKVARRARASKWETVQRVPGVTMVEVDEKGEEVASARAFLPSPVNDVDPVLNKLQITGADLPVVLNDAEPVAGAQDRAVIYVDSSLNMTVGKAAAQVSHGSQLLAAVLSQETVDRWRDADFPLEVREVSAGRFRALRSEILAAPVTEQNRWITRCGGESAPMILVQDAGHTEVAPGSATVIAQWLPAGA